MQEGNIACPFFSLHILSHFYIYINASVSGFDSALQNESRAPQNARSSCDRGLRDQRQDNPKLFLSICFGHVKSIGMNVAEIHAPLVIAARTGI